MYNGFGCSLCSSYLIFLKYLMKMKYFGLTETKLFHFHWIFKNGERESGSSETPDSPLDPPLDLWIRHWISRFRNVMGHTWVTVDDSCWLCRHCRHSVNSSSVYLNFLKKNHINFSGSV